MHRKAGRGVGLASSGKHFRPTVRSENPLLDTGRDQGVVEFRATLRATVEYGEADTVPVAFFQDGEECL